MNWTITYQQGSSEKQAVIVNQTSAGNAIDVFNKFYKNVKISKIQLAPKNNT